MSTWNERPTIAGFDVLEAEDLDAIMDQIDLASSPVAVLGANHAGVANTTLATTTLARPVRASQYVIADAMAFYCAPAAGDIKFNYTGPSGTTLIRGFLMSHPSSTDADAGDIYMKTDTNLNNLSAPGRTSLTDIMWCRVVGIYSVGATAGSLALQYARATGTGTASDTQLKAGSTLRVTPCEVV